MIYRSFAYVTVRDRLPVTITKVIDHLVRDKEQIVKTFGQVSPTDKRLILYQPETKSWEK